MTGELAIAIVTHDSVAVLERRIEGHIALAGALQAPLVFADNGSRDGTVVLLEAWREREPRLMIVRLDRNRGYAAGVNAAFAAVPGHDVLLINPDVGFEGPRAVEALAVELARRPRAAAAGPALYDPSGARQPSARRFPTGPAILASLPRAGAIPWLRARRAEYLAPSRANESTPVEWVTGAAMLIRREAYDELGGWDERYFLYLEDVDFCLRLRRAGWEVIYVPNASAVHDYARESLRPGASLARSRARRRHVRSFARFFAREAGLLIGRSPRGRSGR